MKSRARILTLIAILLSFGALARAEGLPPLRILSLNVFAGTSGMEPVRLRRQIRGVRELAPDVIALQEAFDPLVRQEYRRAFPDYEIIDTGDAPQPRSLSRRALRAFPFWGRGQRSFLDGDPHGLVILLNRRRGIPLPQTRLVWTYHMQAAPDAATRLLEAVKPKAALLVQYVVDGQPLLIANTHLSNGVSNPQRVGQLAEMLELINRHGRDLPVIFTGDTNADAMEPEMRWFHEGAGFIDSFALLNPGVHGATWDNRNPLTEGFLREVDQRVDYVSLRASTAFGFAVAESRLVFDQGEPVSDHYGMFTVVVPGYLCPGNLSETQL